MQKKYIYITLAVALIAAWYFVPVWYGGYSGFKVYKVVEFITEIFPRAVIALQARHGRDLSKLKDEQEKPKDLKKTIVERGLPQTTMYAEQWKVSFSPETIETKLYYPLLSKSTPEFEKVRQEVLSKLNALSKRYEFIKKVEWDGRYIIVTYQTLRLH